MSDGLFCRALVSHYNKCLGAVLKSCRQTEKVCILAYLLTYLLTALTSYGAPAIDSSFLFTAVLGYTCLASCFVAFFSLFHWGFQVRSMLALANPSPLPSPDLALWLTPWLLTQVFVADLDRLIFKIALWRSQICTLSVHYQRGSVLMLEESLCFFFLGDWHSLNVVSPIPNLRREVVI